MEEGLGENWHLESQGGVVFWYFECSLARLRQPAGAGHRLEQPGVENLSWEEEVKVQLCVALSACSFYTALRKVSCGEQVFF